MNSTILILSILIIILILFVKSENYQYIVPITPPPIQLQKDNQQYQQAQQENKINPLSQPQYNYNNWKQKYMKLCESYNNTTKIDENSEYQQGSHDLIMNAKIKNQLTESQGLVYKYGQCVENGNRGCNCPDSSFTFVEDMSKVLANAPKQPGCIQLKESPYCYSLDGVVFQPDFNRLSTEQ